MRFILPFENFQIYIQNAPVIKVVNSILFHLEWLKHSVSIQKTEQNSSHFKSRFVPDFSAKFYLERSGFISHVSFRF